MYDCWDGRRGAAVVVDGRRCRGSGLAEDGGGGEKERGDDDAVTTKRRHLFGEFEV